MKIYKFSPKNYFGSNNYVLESFGEGAVVDPSVDYFTVTRELGDNMPKIKYIILTHVHFDHMLKINEWQQKTNAEVLVGKYDIPALTDGTRNAYRLFLGVDDGYHGAFTSLSGGDKITLGKENVTVLETPGHTEGSISLIFDGAVIVGDLVFAGGGIGRYDLPGGSYSALMRSIEKIKLLNNDTVVYSGHGENTTVLQIKR